MRTREERKGEVRRGEERTGLREGCMAFCLRTYLELDVTVLTCRVLSSKYEGCSLARDSTVRSGSSVTTVYWTCCLQIQGTFTSGSQYTGPLFYLANYQLLLPSSIPPRVSGVRGVSKFSLI